MKVIDAHAHIYPDKIAVKASGSISEFYDIPVKYDGTVGTLLESGARDGIAMHLVHSVATVPEQVESINNFIAKAVAEHQDKFIGFATLHQDMEDIEQELDRITGLGLRGIKLHPDFQRFYIDEPKLDRIYSALEGRLPLLIHTGDYRYKFSSPSRAANVLTRFPKLDMICAHFGGWSEWDESERLLAGRRVWVDTSSSLAFMTPERGRRLVDAFGEDRIIFGTDYPMWDAASEFERLEKLGLSWEAKEKIFYKNICGLLGMA
ncbi:MAG: amidohydrolase family protein [Clostridiales bacterium]|jgi:predicted TIM-barrel fold metal-dependent hydrolase|nr:amidohydrolase family protein [Clostridiales bacterium]